jgi:hypothetical protein
VGDEEIRIRQVFYSETVLEKLWSKHKLEQWEVDDALDDPDAEPRWEHDPRHGRRVVVLGKTQEGREVFVALVAIDLPQGLWSCITAFEPEEAD